ncbi:MAG TPA: hypothetical protein VFS53_05080, partial [Gemmatimonadota bacterium]|nr:hypothetical protein [Gemmatimonadota bacterium]
MRQAFSALLSATIAVAVPLGIPDLRAQSVTSAVIQGSVESIDGMDLDGAEVVVLNAATGFT